MENKRMNNRYFRSALATMMLCIALRLRASRSEAQAPGSLYERLGGKPAINAVVDEFVTRVAADKRVSGFFAGVARDPARLAGFPSKLVDLICEATCGLCKYAEQRHEVRARRHRSQRF